MLAAATAPGVWEALAPAANTGGQAPPSKQAKQAADVAERDKRMGSLLSF